MHKPAGNRSYTNVKPVRQRSYGVSLAWPGMPGTDIPSDLAKVTDSDPGRGIPVALRINPRPGQTRNRNRIYADQTANRGHMSPTTNRNGGPNPVTSDNTESERSG